MSKSVWRNNEITNIGNNKLHTTINKRHVLTHEQHPSNIYIYIYIYISYYIYIYIYIHNTCMYTHIHLRIHTYRLATTPSDLAHRQPSPLSRDREARSRLVT